MRKDLPFETFFSILLVLTFVSCAEWAEWDENRRLERLAKVQDDPNNFQAFTTDGCSGFQSDSWKILAEYSSLFKEKLGKEPPWENCCVEHDKTYWKGETEDGYQKRLEADEILNACVAKTGEDMSEELAEKWGKSQDQIKSDFSTMGSIMYEAVRVGGKPCTVYSWRWGYGWPKCPD